MYVDLCEEIDVGIRGEISWIAICFYVAREIECLLSCFCDLHVRVTENTEYITFLAKGGETICQMCIRGHYVFPEVERSTMAP